MAENVEMLLGLAGEPLATYLRDGQVTEVMCNDNGTCFLSRLGEGMIEVEHPGWRVLDVFLGAIADASGKEWRVAVPRLGAALSWAGWRVQAGRPPAAPNIFMSLRKHPNHVFPLDDYEAKGILTPRARRIVEDAMVSRKRIIVAGGVGSAKTSLLNALLHAIRDTQDRVIIAEDDPEIICTVRNCTRNYVVKGQSTLRDVVQDTLRLNPSRLVVGEIRGGECLDMLQAFQTGHSGLTTVHVDKVENTMSRLEQLVQIASVAPQSQLIANVLDLVIHMEKHVPLWRCTGIIAVGDYVNGHYETEKLE